MRDPRTRTRRAFLTLGLGALGAYGGWHWLRRWVPRELGMPAPLRQVVEANGALWEAISDPSKAPRVEASSPPADGTAARVNGLIGLEPDAGGALAGDVKDATIDVAIDQDEGSATRLSADIWRQLPRTKESALFCCIEGWSEPMTYSGVRFSDLLEHLKLGRKRDGTFYRFVGLATPDDAYYVSIDMKSMLHPQTLLADELNGRPLTPGHGAPLRLMIPIKYGIKSLKRVGSIEFSDERPDDYWHQRGYDWYASL